MRRIIGELAGPALLLLFCVVVGVNSQENAIKNLSPSLLECYDIYEKWNLLPHNMETLIAIIRKIEAWPTLNMDMRQLSAAILHRFRQDGIVRNPKVKTSPDIKPYAPLGQQFFRHAQTLRVIPASPVSFPDECITPLERCTLHSMISSSIDIFERGDESRVCKVANYAYHRRYGRSAELSEGKSGVKGEVETLSPEQIEMMTKADIGVDPNAQYPALPPNHPSVSARLTNLPPFSRCPTENGVIKTPWGTVSGGSVLAGIAAGLEPQMIRLGDLIKQQTEQRVLSYSKNASLDSKFLGTLAGDLAEVALVQGPKEVERFTLGAEGNWNSSSDLLYYFLNANEHLQMTAAEIRGDLDGLILGHKVPGYSKKVGGLLLSQVLDMYYSDRGLFVRSNRACNRRAHLLEVAPTDTLVSQTHSAAVVLSSGIATVTFLSEAIQRFSARAVKDLQSFIPTMNSDMSCEVTHSQNVISQPAVDLTIIVDTNWPYDKIKPILTQLLQGLEINKFNSNFSLVNGLDGTVMIPSSNDILDFHAFNQLSYDNHTQFGRKGFDFPKILDVLRDLQTTKLNEERSKGWAGGKSDVVLMVTHQSPFPNQYKELCYERLKTMREEVPDAVILFLTYGNKDQWADFVLNRDNDVVTIPISETTDSYPQVDTMQARIKQVPRRLINSRCGADYIQSDQGSSSVRDFVGPNAVNYYRIHPNYFSSSDTENPPRIRIVPNGSSGLKICYSRELMHVNATSANAAAQCTPDTSRTHIIDMKDACAGTTYLFECKPYYLSISLSSNNTDNYPCTDQRSCRYPDDVEYKINFENLVCKSGATTLFAAPMFLLILLAKLL